VKWWLVCDLEDFNFFDFDFLRTRENDVPGQSGVVGVNGAQVTPTAGACVSVIVNNNVLNVWTEFGITNDCPALLVGSQRKSPRRDVVRILQREKETFQTVIHFHTVL
jgi:hypothetical protein